MRVGILTSGGDAPGMNAAIRAVVRTGIFNNMEIFGIKEGYKGLMEGKISEMDLSSVADIIQKGGTCLRTARSKEFMMEEGLNQALNVLKVYKIDKLIVLGGDGTLKGAKKLADNGIDVMGIPCTIDNDCGYTDYTVGFMTAVETVVDAISKIRDTSTSHGRANIIEVMGRNCGDIALYSGLSGGAESILLPEIDLEIDDVAKKVLQGKNRGKRHHIIILAEGVGNPYTIAEKINEKTSVDTRVTILGYIQRGGVPSTHDRILASKMGNQAVELLAKGKKNKALGFKNNRVINLDIEKALLEEKTFDIDMYDMTKVLSI